MPAFALRARGSVAVAVVMLSLAAMPPGCASGPPASPDRGASLAALGEGPLSPGRYDLVVRGMSCPKCISNVDLQLKRIEGVLDPKVDMKHGIVTITVREGSSPSRAAIATAIGDAGFTLAEIREVPR